MHACIVRIACIACIYDAHLIITFTSLLYVFACSYVHVKELAIHIKFILIWHACSGCRFQVITMQTYRALDADLCVWSCSYACCMHVRYTVWAKTFMGFKFLLTKLFVLLTYIISKTSSITICNACL